MSGKLRFKIFKREEFMSGVEILIKAIIKEIKKFFKNFHQILDTIKSVRLIDKNEVFV